MQARQGPGVHEQTAAQCQGLEGAHQAMGPGPAVRTELGWHSGLGTPTTHDEHTFTWEIPFQSVTEVSEWLWRDD